MTIEPITSAADSEIAAVPPPLDFLLSRRSVGQFDRNLAFVGEGLIGGDDEAGLPDKARRARAAGVYGDDSGRGLRSEAGDGGGK